MTREREREKKKKKKRESEREREEEERERERFKLYLFLCLWPVTKEGWNRKCRRPKKHTQFALTRKPNQIFGCTNGSSRGDAPCYVFYVKHQALVYDILPSTTAIVDYAIGLEKLSANEQFFDDAQTAVSL